MSQSCKHSADDGLHVNVHAYSYKSLWYGGVMLDVACMQAHTFLEIIEVRWGFWAHMLFGFYAFMTNFIVSIMMVMGAVVVTHTLTGVNQYGQPPYHRVMFQVQLH